MGFGIRSPFTVMCFAAVLFQIPSETHGAVTLTDPATVNLAENSVAETVAKTLATTGETGAVTFSILETQENFMIAAAEVQVKSGATLNFEGVNVFLLTIQAVDTEPSTSTGTLTVSLTDVEEAPAFTSNTFSVQMYSGAVADTEVGTFMATDEDAGASGTIAGYTILAGNTGATFTNTNGMIKVATGKSLDFNTVAAYILIFVANDGATTSLTGTTTVQIAVAACSGVAGTTAGIFTLLGGAVMVLVTSFI